LFTRSATLRRLSSPDACPIPPSSTLHERLDRKGAPGVRRWSGEGERSAGPALAARLSLVLGDEDRPVGRSASWGAAPPGLSSIYAPAELAAGPRVADPVSRLKHAN
jgi:hypothetical protein